VIVPFLEKGSFSKQDGSMSGSFWSPSRLE